MGHAGQQAFKSSGDIDTLGYVSNIYICMFLKTMKITINNKSEVF
jgi:hypothetical protein